MAGGDRHPVAWVDLPRPMVVMGREHDRLGLAEPTLGDLRGLSVGALVGSPADGSSEEVQINPLRADVDQWVTLLTRIGVPRPTRNDVERLPSSTLMSIVAAGVPLLVGGGEEATPPPAG